MTANQKIKYMKIAADLCQFHFKHDQLDLLISLYELVILKEGNADMWDVAKVKAKIEERRIEAEKKVKK